MGTALPCDGVWWLSPLEGEMQVHDAVGINYENGATEVSSIWAKGCIMMIVCVLSDLTLLPLIGGGRKL